MLAQGKVVAHGTPKSVLGDVLGEHVVVLEAGNDAMPAVAPGSARAGSASRSRSLAPGTCRSSGEQLAAFARAFPALRYEVRPPNLDDLFLKLALPCAG